MLNRDCSVDQGVDRHVLEPMGDRATPHYLEEPLAGVLVPLFFSGAKSKAWHQRCLNAFKAAEEL